MPRVRARSFRWKIYEVEDLIYFEKYKLNSLFNEEKMCVVYVSKFLELLNNKIKLKK